MPVFKTKEQIYERCVAEGKLAPSEEPDKDKIKTTLQIAEEDLEAARDSMKKKRWNSGYKAYYDVLRELVEALLSFDKIKSWNHQCLFSYICVKHPELELSWDFFEKIRTKRNGINYYSAKVSEEDWNEVKLQFELYINSIKKEIKKKISEL